MNIHQQALRSEARDTILSWLSTRLHQEWKAQCPEPDVYAKRFIGASMLNEMIFSPANTDGLAIQYVNDVTFRAWEELNKKGIEARIVFPKSTPPLHSLAIDLIQTNLKSRIKSLEAETLGAHDASRRYTDIALKGMRSPKDTPPQR